MRDGLAWIGCRYVGAYTHRRTARGPSHSCAFHRGAYTRADAAGWNIYGSSIGERWAIARYTMSRSMCRRCDRLSYPLSGTGVAPRPLDSGNFHGGHGRLSWKRLSGGDVPRTAPPTCAGDCRGSAVSAVFSRERFQGRFSQPRISNVPVGRFILTARNSRKLPRRIGEYRCESENPAGSPGRTSPNGSIRRKLPVHHPSAPRQQRRSGRSEPKTSLTALAGDAVVSVSGL